MKRLAMPHTRKWIKLLLAINVLAASIVLLAVRQGLTIGHDTLSRYDKFSSSELKVKTRRTSILKDPSFRIEQKKSVVADAEELDICAAYAELRNFDFMNKSVRTALCKGVTAFSIVNGVYPLCELQDQLPEILTSTVKSGSQISYLISPVTSKSIPCFVYQTSDLISDAIKKEHCFDERNVKEVLNIIRMMRVSLDLPVTLVDIGSNVGVFTLSALDIGVPVVALDANIRNLIRVKLSAEWSKKSSQLTLLWGFISSQVALMRLNFPKDCNIGGATKFRRTVVDTIPVMSTTADALIKTIRTKHVVLKIDIEGGEADFFKSSTALFDKFNIPVVLMEWLRRHMTESERQSMIDFFHSRNYSPRLAADVNQQIDINDGGDFDLLWIHKEFELKNKIF